MARYQCSLDNYFDPTLAALSIRKNGIYINSSCCELANLHEFRAVQVFRDHELPDWSTEIYIKGSNEKPSAENMAFSNDRRKRKNGRGGPLYISCKRLIGQFSSLRHLASQKRENARVLISFDEEKKEIVVPIVPQFEHVCNSIEQLPKSPGIYSYMHTNDCVYIGKGINIFKRAQEDKRESWIFDSIRFSYIVDETKRTYWENHFLEKHKLKYGILPRFNMISGSSKYALEDNETKEAA